MSKSDHKSREVLIVRSHVESGGRLKVMRLEPSKAGARLLTSSSSIINGDKKPTSGAWVPRGKTATAV